MKKILFLIECMAVGGAEKILINLVNNLDKHKYDITVMMVYKYNTYGENNVIFEKLFNDYIKIKYCFNNKTDFRYRNYNRILNRVSKNVLYRKLIGENYDIEVAFYEGIPTALIANSTNRKSIKIAWLHTDSLNRTKDFTEKMINDENEIYLKYTKIVAVSRSVESSFKKIHPCLLNTYVKYNPIDTNEILSKATEENLIDNCDRVKFIAVGRLVKVKGFERLINVMKRLNEEKKEFSLTIVGDGPLKKELNDSVIEAGLENEIKLVGFQKNPYKFIDGHDVLICSSYAEGYSTVVLEAIILGIPVITTECAGMEEIFFKNKCGEICENSEKGLYESIKMIIDNSELIEEYKMQCKIRAEELRIEKSISSIQEIL